MRRFLISLLLLVFTVISPVAAQNDGSDFGMTGIVLSGQGDFRSVIKVLAHSPAAEAGIKQGDTILAINGTGTAGLELNELVGKVRGKPGTEVVLAVMSRETGVAFSFTLKRVSSRAYYAADPSD